MKGLYMRQFGVYMWCIETAKATTEGMKMNGRAMIIGGKLAISHNGSAQIWGIRAIRKAIAQIEASKTPIKASTYVAMCSYKAAVSLWEGRTK